MYKNRLSTTINIINNMEGNTTMVKSIRYDGERNKTEQRDFDLEIPNICHHCHYTGHQRYMTAVTLDEIIYTLEVVETKFVVLTACTFCHKVTQHFYTEMTIEGIIKFNLDETIPKKESIQVKIPKNISQFSSDFVNIFNQAMEAEQNELDQLAGMGYRKAVEFLITDYLLVNVQNEEDAIWIKSPKTTLSNKIDKLPNERIKKLAKAISFIGNDETHYTRRHPEYDIDNLKAFIKALLSDFENELILEEAEKLIDKPN